MENFGLILGIRPEDFKAGANSPLPFQERNPSGDWTNFCPPGEFQYNNKIDYMACVTYSALNSLETQVKFLTGETVNFSDRWIAKLSGTTHQGNYLYNVVDAIRKYGLVLEEDYPTDPNFTWEQYYADIPADSPLFAKGQDWLKKWKVSYEWVSPTVTELQRHLKHAPIQLALYNPSHAVENVLLVTDPHYFDSYEPWFKDTPITNVASALKIILEPLSMPQFKTQNKDGELRIVLAASSMEEWNALCKVFGVNPTTTDETVTNK